MRVPPAGASVNQSIHESENPSDREGLIALFRAANGSRWSRNSNWLSDAPLTDWQGVTTSNHGRVIGLDLRSNGLTGHIPSELGSLSALKVLNLSGNQLTGSMPSDLGSLHELEELDLSENTLSGPIPAEIWNLRNLTHLYLHANTLVGQIPPQISNLGRLSELQLGQNRISGPIPGSIGSLRRLRGLELSQNALTGTIPAELGEMPRLARIYLSGNDLTGPIPPELGNLPVARTISLGDNRLSGTVPASLGNLITLRELRLEQNLLSGPIPPEIGQLQGLAVLRMEGNALSGHIPSELGQMYRLWILYLGDNQLSGPIPPDLGQLTRLGWLNLAGNRLSGELPPQLGALNRLDHAYLSGNEFTGCVPPNLKHVPNSDTSQLGLGTCNFGLHDLITPAGRLIPRLDSINRNYVLRIGLVEQFTLQTWAGASLVEYFDGSGGAIDDLDPDVAGHQIRLHRGNLSIRLVVTSADGEEQATYLIDVRPGFADALTVMANEYVTAPGNPDLKHNIPDLRVEVDGQILHAGFLAHYRATGGLERWGYPTSEILLLEPKSLTQFYQRGVVDFHNVGVGWVVERRLAWDYLGGGLGGSADLGVEEGITNPHFGLVSGPWGHKVSNFAIDGTEIGFADFYGELGGLQAFGYPKTDARRDTNRAGTLHVGTYTPGFIRQYYQAAVLEFHPGDEAAPVKLALLGNTLRELLVGDWERESAFAAAQRLVGGEEYRAPFVQER